MNESSTPNHHSHGDALISPPDLFLVQPSKPGVNEEDEGVGNLASSVVLASSPISPLDLPTLSLLSQPAAAAAAMVSKPKLPHLNSSSSFSHADSLGDLLTLSLQTVVGSSEILGHSLENRDSISSLQDPAITLAVQLASTTPLRDNSQEPLFIIAPLDVLVTHEEPSKGNKGRRNRFHIIEINGTGIAGITNMAPSIIQAMMKSISEIPARDMPQVQDPLILVASSGQESSPPVSRTMHEKMLYIEALRKGFLAEGRSCTVANMTRLEQRPHEMPSQGPTLVLGYMMQFRKSFSVDDQGRLTLFGRVVSGAINDRFILNIMHQFKGKIDPLSFKGYNGAYPAGADKGIAYSLYNEFMAPSSTLSSHPCMAPSMVYERADTRSDLILKIQSWLSTKKQPCVIKPQGTGCGHGIEFFFGDETEQEVAAKVDTALNAVAKNYLLECQGLPYTICQFLDTATVNPDHIASEAGSKMEHLSDHKFEVRVVVYRQGGQLHAFPSIAKVARAAFDPTDPHPDKGSLINNITTSSKETAQSGAEFMLPLCNEETLSLLGISVEELKELGQACTAFVRFVIDKVQDEPTKVGLGRGLQAPS